MQSLEGAAASLPMTRSRAGVRPRVESRQFFVRMAYACAFVAIVGFTPTYWARVATGSFVGSPLLHLHGVLFTAWTLLFIVQARLAAGGSRTRHRALGLAGISLATAMLFVGLMVALSGLELRISQGYEQAGRGFAIVPISTVLLFATLFAAAVANVRRPDVHMRLMLVASIAVLPPAIARLVLLAATGVARPTLGPPPGVEFALVSAMLANVLLALAILRDWRVRGRPHQAYLIAGAWVVGVQILRIPISRTEAWQAFTRWLQAFGG